MAAGVCVCAEQVQPRGGLFFSEGLYLKFHELRTELYEAIHTTRLRQNIGEAQASKIRAIVCGIGGPKEAWQTA
jgi:hypothetical protein